jgi:hydroxymethylglutaryl-CoA synthase
VGIFAYGSGLCCEFYSALIGPEAKQAVRRIRLREALDARKMLTVAEYEAVEHERTEYIDQPTYVVPREGLGNHYEKQYAGRGLLVLRGLEGYFRQYEWS